MDDQDRKYAGWFAESYTEAAYAIFHDEELDLSMRGCLATRIIFASGVPLVAAQADEPDEMAWVLSFKFGNAYEV